MADEQDKPDVLNPPGVVTRPDAEGTPPPSSIPAATEVSGADAEKAAMVEQAKSRVAAVKENLASAAPPSDTPKAPVKKKEEGPKPVDASAHPLVEKLRQQFDGAVVEAQVFLDQLSIRIDPARVVEVCDYLKRQTTTAFDYLSDLTCVHYPLRTEAPFEIVYNLFSISRNERVRLKAGIQEGDGIDSVTSVWPSANWMEREVFDLFGVKFRNHPDLRRILLPPDWQGHPLRKDYPLEFVENEWTERHLPEFSDVQLEQLEQRRAYGLEVLSVPQERMMREILQSGKEVMPKDK